MADLYRKVRRAKRLGAPAWIVQRVQWGVSGAKPKPDTILFRAIERFFDHVERRFLRGDGKPARGVLS